jgi:hypothetical protein
VLNCYPRNSKMPRRPVPLTVQEKTMRSAYALRRWLAREILEREIPRKPPKRATESMGPARNALYRAWIRSLPCCRCGLEPAGEAAHTGRDGGMGQKASDYSCVPLCRDCHTQNADSYHRLGRADFGRRYRVDLTGLVIRLNRHWVDAGCPAMPPEFRASKRHELS